jgi:voltage-gated potassium channel
VARSSHGQPGEPVDDAPEVVDVRAELSALHPRNWRERLGGPDRYGVLLSLIIITIVTSVVLHDNEWERLAAVTMVAVMLLFALRTSQAPKRLQRFALAFVPLIVLGTATAAAVRDNDAADIRVGMTALTTFLLLAVLFAIVRRLSTHLTISWPTILGALCVYLVFGMVFASTYALAGPLQDGLLYFSLVTLTTVGFGDLTMRADVTRIMSAMEALLGQIYLITAVGLLIGNLGRARRPGRGIERD